MTYENIKSVILIILVCFSVFLTWSIWTYQPNYDVMEKPNTVEKVAISDKKEVEEIVRPDRVYYHLSKEKHFGSVDKNEIRKIIDEMSSWNFTGFENISTDIASYSSFIHNKGNAVILFPDSIPIDLYRTIIEIKEDDPPNFQFDRIVVDMENTQKEQGQVYFISSKDKKAFRSHVPSSFIENFHNGFFKNIEYNQRYSKHIPITVSTERILFVPADKTKMLRYQYLSNPLESEKFKNALFKDPSVVQKNYQPTGEEYKDYSSLLRVNYEKNTLSYVNPVESNEKNVSSNNLLKRSIDFVNEHGGWTDNYRFVKVDESTNKVLFRLYEDKGYPVFSEESKISEIRHRWGQNEILEYSRSNFSFGVLTETTETILSSGQTAFNLLEGMEGFEIEQLQDLMLGYKMTKDSQTRLVYLEPSWYYKSDDDWKRVPMDEIGGGNHGLE